MAMGVRDFGFGRRSDRCDLDIGGFTPGSRNPNNAYRDRHVGSSFSLGSFIFQVQRARAVRNFVRWHLGRRRIGGGGRNQRRVRRSNSNLSMEMEEIAHGRGGESERLKSDEHRQRKFPAIPRAGSQWSDSWNNPGDKLDSAAAAGIMAA